MIESIKEHKQATAASKLKTKELQEQAFQLSKEIEEMERLIEEKHRQGLERQHQERTSQRIEETWKFNYSREILPDVWWIPPTDE